MLGEALKRFKGLEVLIWPLPWPWSGGPTPFLPHTYKDSTLFTLVTGMYSDREPRGMSEFRHLARPAYLWAFRCPNGHESLESASYVVSRHHWDPVSSPVTSPGT